MILWRVDYSSAATGGAAASLERRILDAALRSDILRMHLALQRIERGANHVVRVRRTHRLGDDVMHAERLEDGAHRTAGDDAGTGLGGAQQNLAGAMAALDVVMQRAARAQRHEDQVALGRFGRLADRLRHFARLAVTEADAALLVADDDERGKAEATAALDDLGDAVDVDELVDEFAVALFAVTAAVATVPTFLCHILFLVLFRKHGLMMQIRRLLRVSSRAANGSQKLRPPSRAASASALTRP